MPANVDLCGRDGPLKTLRDLLAKAKNGHGTMVLVTGEAGIGKSALATVIAGAAEDEGVKVVRGRAWELADAPPYFPLWSCFRALGLEPPRGRVEDGDAFRLWERVLGELAAVATRETVLWVLEDMHAADVLTLDLLTLLAQPIRTLRVIVIMTLRRDDPRTAELAGHRLARIGRDGVEVALEPLALPDVAVLASQAARRKVATATAAAIAHRTGGNPLFVIEYARALNSSDTIAAVPRTIRELIMERFMLLPAATQRSLEAAAILGREFAASTVARMQGTLPAKVIDDFSPALRAAVVVETAPGAFSFTHILVLECIEQSLSKPARTSLHARAAEVLGTLGDGVDVVVERARHELAAMRSHDSIALARRAAEILEQQGAFDRAYALHLRIAEAGEAYTWQERLHLADLARSAGRHSDARRICGDVIAAARTAKDPELFAHAALVAGAELRPTAVDRVLVAMLEEALALAGSAPEHAPMRCRLQARLAAALQPAPDPAVPMAMARDAITRARQIGDEDLILEVMHGAAAAIVEIGPLAERLALSTELLSRAQRRGDARKVLRACTRLALEQLSAGNFVGWEENIDRALLVSQTLAHPRHRWTALLLASMRAIVQGDYTASDRYVVEVQQLATLTDDPALMLSLTAHLGERARMLHRDDEMRMAAQFIGTTTADVPGALVLVAAIRSAIAARLEDVDGMRAAIVSLGVHAEAAESVLGWSAILAEAYAAVGTDEQRRRLRGHLELHLREHFSGGHIPFVYGGPVSRCVGLLDASLGDVARAESLLREALDSADKRGQPGWGAPLRDDRARGRARAGRETEASELRASAAALADELGMIGLSVRARAGGPTAAPSPSMRFALVPEGEVWRVDFGERTLRIKDRRGMQLLSRLVERSGEEIHVLALAADEGGGLIEAGTGDLDMRALRAYKDRLDEIAGLVDEAENRGDAGTLDKLRREQTALEAEVARSTGLGGRPRATGSASERARVNIQRRLKDAIERIRHADSVVGNYLEKAVRTGTYCSFRP